MKKQYVTFKARRNDKDTKVKFQIKQSIVQKRLELLWNYIESNHQRIFKKFKLELKSDE